MDNYLINYGLMIIAFLITVVAQIFINITYQKYSKVGNLKKMTGRDAARYILDKNGLKDIYIVETKGFLSDHYDPSRKVIRLSSKVYNEDTVASVAVAAHECGHAIQDKENYKFLRIRAALVPLVNFSSYAGYLAIVIGIIFQMMDLIWVGILLEVIILLFQLVTLPVEIDASKRALKEIEKGEILNSQELSQGKTVLVSAALTYVASLATTILEILRLILVFTRNDD